jgi:beta-N-acetylhexosaminidase
MRRTKESHRVRLWLVALIFVLILPPQAGLASPFQQSNEPESRAQDLLARLSPEERVGQLFIVTFTGTDVGPENPINTLIKEHHIGGVILLAKNDNFTSNETNINDIWVLNNQLQTIQFASSQEEQINPYTGEMFTPAYVPLFLGISQEGDGYPNDQILSGLTPIPSQMAVGATWNPDLAKQVGEIAGKELAALGFNILFGPSLDVVETPRPGGTSDLGVRAFGGDPFWVGKMGSAYIEGVHQGAEGRIAVVGTHFPGLGSSDRLPIDEVATVRKSLEQLKQIELAPFFAVTGNASTPEATVDALLTSHIRYQGLQGNIRATTRPISFDQNALNLLMGLEPMITWREGGGVMISDDLGSRAVRRFYDPTDEGFNPLRPARDALLAGNDLLYLGNYEENTESQNNDAILQTLDFFAQKYREDPAFTQRVDEAVLRILTLKYKLYEFFTLNLVLPPGDDIHDIGQDEAVTFEVAHQAATLISPAMEELDPATPELYDRMVFFSDSYQVQQCSECPLQENIPHNALEQTIVNLYGPEAGGQIASYYLISHTFEDLIKVLDGTAETTTVESTLSRADWIVFILLDVHSDRPSSQALHRFLSERSDLARQKQVIVFAANAPYYLDATDISKLDAYYGLYNKTTPFVDIAARLLFKEITAPLGALPVSVPGVGYDLISQTSPNPEQRFEITLDLPEIEIPQETATPEAMPLPEYFIGDTVPLRTGVILDHNGHPVPNNTPVQFLASKEGESLLLSSVTTVDGVARTTFMVEQAGTLEIYAVSEPAQSEVLVLEIPEPIEEIIEDTPESSPTISPTETPSATPTVTTPPPTPTPTPEPTQPPAETGLLDWSLASLTTLVIGWGVSRIGALMGQVRWGIRWGLSAFISGLLAYTYIILGLPGSDFVTDIAGLWGILAFTVIGTIFGWGLAVIIRTFTRRSDQSTNHK